MFMRTGIKKLSLVVLTMLCCAASVSCGGSDGGGGGGGTPLPRPLLVSFGPDLEDPGPNTVSLQPGATVGDTFTANVSFTDTDDVLGVSFRVTYDRNILQFVRAVTSNSFLTGPNVGVFVDPDHDSNDDPSRGEVWVVVAPFDLDNPPAGVNVDGTRTLIGLTFRARQVSNGSSVAFSVSGREVSSSQNCQAGVCDPIDVAAWAGGSVVVTN